MSSTAYQRAAIDLDKAGLNRILALGSPASSPGGSTAVMQNPKGPLAQGVSNSAKAALDANEQVHRTNNIEEDTALKYDTRAEVRAREAASLAQTALTKAQTATEYRKAAGIDTDIKQKELEMEIRNLQKIGINSEAELWKQLSNMDLDGLIKIAPLVGPTLAPVIKALIMGFLK